MPLIHLIGTRKFKPETAGPLEQLETYLAMADDIGMTLDMRTHARFSLAQAQDQIAEVCDRRGDAAEAARFRDRAWAHVAGANRDWFLLDRGSGYDRGRYAALVRRLEKAYATAGALEALANPDAAAGRNFVFLVGTPRCGSTLAERVLLASGAALPLGEIGTFPRMLRHLAGELGVPSAEAGGMFDAGRDVAAYLERLVALPRAEAIKRVRKIADEYVDTTSALCSLEHSQLDNSEKNRGMSASREVLYVDKQLDNHAHVAIIRAALPAAKIVWCARDARDVGLSQFFHAFEAEHNPRAYDYCYSLDGLAHYHAHNARLLKHWLDAVPGVHVLRYERLVGDFDAVARELYDVCGLRWSAEDARNFHKPRPEVGVALTASVLQTKEPLYAKSMGKWTKYARHLAPFVDKLDDAETLTDAFFRDVHVLGDAYGRGKAAREAREPAPEPKPAPRPAPEPPETAKAAAPAVSPPKRVVAPKPQKAPAPSPQTAPSAVRLVFEGDETGRPAPFALKLSRVPGVRGATPPPRRGVMTLLRTSSVDDETSHFPNFRTDRAIPARFPETIARASAERNADAGCPRRGCPSPRRTCPAGPSARSRSATTRRTRRRRPSRPRTSSSARRTSSTSSTTATCGPRRPTRSCWCSESPSSPRWLRRNGGWGELWGAMLIMTDAAAPWADPYRDLATSTSTSTAPRRARRRGRGSKGEGAPHSPGDCLSDFYVVVARGRRAAA